MVTAPLALSPQYFEMPSWQKLAPTSGNSHALIFTCRAHRSINEHETTARSDCRMTMAVS